MCVGFISATEHDVMFLLVVYHVAKMQTSYLPALTGQHNNRGVYSDLSVYLYMFKAKLSLLLYFY